MTLIKAMLGKLIEAEHLLNFDFCKILKCSIESKKLLNVLTKSEAQFSLQSQIKLNKLYMESTVDVLSTCHLVLNLGFKKELQMMCFIR